MNLRIPGNVARPAAWENPGPGKSWHHIIPAALLRDVWNGAVQQHIYTDFGEARRAVHRFLLLCTTDEKIVDEWLDRMRLENTNRKQSSEKKLQPLPYSEILTIQQLAVWPHWNIVAGPSGETRSDDPSKNGKYELDRFKTGLKNEEVERMKEIEVLFDAFQIFANGPAPGPAALRNLAVAAARAQHLVLCDGPIPFRKDMWVEDKETGKWRKAQAADAAIKV